MILYHFTALHLLDSIKHDGITLGCVVIFGESEHPLDRIKGFKKLNWLTKNGKWFQEWCDPEYSNLPYDRSAVRLTLELPEDFPVMPWNDFAVGELERTKKVLNEFGDPENWYVSEQDISPDYITDIRFKK